MQLLAGCNIPSLLLSLQVKLPSGSSRISGPDCSTTPRLYPVQPQHQVISAPRSHPLDVVRLLAFVYICRPALFHHVLLLPDLTYFDYLVAQVGSGLASECSSDRPDQDTSCVHRIQGSAFRNLGRAQGLSEIWMGYAPGFERCCC